MSGLKFSGSIQSDILIPEEDRKIRTGEYNDWALTNTYADLSLANKHFEVGGRFQFTEHPLPGYENEFKGWGVPYFYFKGHLKRAELTLCDFYEQFGSGLILRNYEERELGVDNALRGGRLVLRPIEGLQVKLIGGKQRRYWHHNKSFVYGGDVEMELSRWIKPLRNRNTTLTVGLSGVSKHEGDESILSIRPTGELDTYGSDIICAYKLHLPKNTGAFDVRADLQTPHWHFLVEYAQKSHDPSFDNGYIYRHGKTLLLSASYSRKGASALLQAKRSEDMSFRSRRSQTGSSSFINNLPVFTMEHTYFLASSYPYATQNVPGEWAFQGSLSYNFKRHSALGGKYGTLIKLNASHTRGIKTSVLYNETGKPVTDLKGTNGYNTSFWKWGSHSYYHDINIQFEKKISKNFKLNGMYMNQLYNTSVIEGEGETVHANIFVLEGKFSISKKTTLRCEAQYLQTKQDEGDRLYGLVELSVLPHFMFSLSDEWCKRVCEAENPDLTHAVHYYMASIAYTHAAHSL
ncbi:MAG: hypothetical protein IJR86_05190, partial [Bacteroidaceae bacterium]|nr:hypothetical protein [Bacteroidaceae bacterium]